MVDRNIRTTPNTITACTHSNDCKQLHSAIRSQKHIIRQPIQSLQTQKQHCNKPGRSKRLPSLESSFGSFSPADRWPTTWLTAAADSVEAEGTKHITIRTLRWREGNEIEMWKETGSDWEIYDNVDLQSKWLERKRILQRIQEELQKMGTSWQWTWWSQHRWSGWQVGEASWAWTVNTPPKSIPAYHTPAWRKSAHHIKPTMLKKENKNKKKEKKEIKTQRTWKANNESITPGTQIYFLAN